MRITLLTILFFILFAVPCFSQDSGYETWTLAGTGAGSLEVNPADGTLWIYFHVSENLVRLDPSDGSVFLDTQLTIRPTSLQFSNDGTIGFIVGEPLDQMIIDQGIVQAFDPETGEILAEIQLDGACNAVHPVDSENIFVAAGMQYAYNGFVYKLHFDRDSGFIILNTAECGKIPWDITVFNDVLYVTDLELQWTLQDDGSMGSPYGAYVWSFDADSMELLDQSWVGINPSALELSSTGVVVACSGNKLGSGENLEPAFCVLSSPDSVASYYIGTSGISDIALSHDGSFGVASLADWGPPVAGSASSAIQLLAPGALNDVYQWVYTGNLAFIQFEGDEILISVWEVLDDSFIREVAISTDGQNIYILDGETELITIVPVSELSL